MDQEKQTFYWYDLETTGLDSRRDRILQFAGLRTNWDLEPQNEPVSTLVKFPPEVIPNPGALVVTKLKPQDCLTHGIEEWQLFQQLARSFQVGDTCLIGFNNLNFDDQFLRFGFYRNLFPPYEHEWKRGNCRLDLLNILRLAAALRPAGIEWPIEDGQPVFSQTALAVANNLDISGAHDAMSDVELSISLARLLKQAQPRLWSYANQLRSKAKTRALLEVDPHNMLLHVHQRYSNARYCVAPVVPIAAHPLFSDRTIVIDLQGDVDALLRLSVDDLRERLFHRKDTANSNSEAIEPLPLNVVATNQSPTVAPIQTLDSKSSNRLKIDVDQLQKTHHKLLAHPDLANKLREVYRSTSEEPPNRVAEEALYDSFVSREDTQACQNFWRAMRRDRQWFETTFTDWRLQELYHRLKVRMAPTKLSQPERTQYQGFVQQQLSHHHPTLEEVEKEVTELMATALEPAELEAVTSLREYLAQLRQDWLLDARTTS